MHSAVKQSLLCSFCRKPQSAVQKLIASPAESIRAYICDECIAACSAICKEDAPAAASDPSQVEEGHPMQTHPQALQLFSALELWLKHESLGWDVTDELALVHRIASQILLDCAK